MSTARKTDIEMVNDSYQRANTLDIYSCELNEDSYIVINNNTGGEYVVTVDHDRQQVVDCTCPHRQYRMSQLNLPCKHIIRIALDLGYDW